MFGGGGGGSSMPAIFSGKLTRQANDLMQKYGLGHWQLMATRGYIDFLTQRRASSARGKKSIPIFRSIGHLRILRSAVSGRSRCARENSANCAAEAAARMAEKLGRYQEDVNNGNAELDLLGNPGTLLLTG